MKQIVDFLQIAEKLECEYRLTRMSDGTLQSVAAHSWNMAMMAIVLQPYLRTPVNMERVLKMCLLHDLPEAIVHDIPLHEQTPDVRMQKYAKETAATKQIVDLLENEDIGACFVEYDTRQTPESRLVKALDILDTSVQHMCAQDLAYVGQYGDNFYWKLFFGDEGAQTFDFEPVLRKVFEQIRVRVAARLKVELGIDATDFIK